jgi:hypothetical protein
MKKFFFFAMFLVLAVFASSQNNLATFSSGYSTLEIPANEDYDQYEDVYVPGWRINGIYEFYPKEEKFTLNRNLPFKPLLERNKSFGTGDLQNGLNFFDQYLFQMLIVAGINLYKQRILSGNVMAFDDLRDSTYLLKTSWCVVDVVRFTCIPTKAQVINPTPLGLSRNCDPWMIFSSIILLTL